MNELKFVASVAERDLDFVLVEELSVNDEFCDWFTSRLYRKPVFASSIGAWHSVTDASLGPTDVLYMFKSDEDGRIAVLIENKIDAGAQPKQAERYRQRGEKGEQAKDWDDFMTCLVAPAQYLSGGNQAESYDGQISYEELMSFFVSRRRRDSRFLFKARLIREAIEKNRRGYQAEISLDMTKFVAEYCEYALRISPSCGVQEARPRPEGSTWVLFKPAGFPGAVSLFHQLTRGFAKLLIGGAANQADTLKARFEPYLTEEVEFGTAGKSLSLSISVPKLDPLTRSFKEEEVQAREGIAAIDRLAAIYRQAVGVGK
ncbi:MAG: PD-(D/E)XK nuclease family protein [Steroidobacteraceae bacterium]